MCWQAYLFGLCAGTLAAVGRPGGRTPQQICSSRGNNGTHKEAEVFESAKGRSVLLHGLRLGRAQDILALGKSLCEILRAGE